jgi:DNA-binding CsgD family transcriptional regulator/type II secretory pathway predicted ATPase ExeA
MTLVGREEEAAALDALFRDCRLGKGAVAVICGPVGSGKTSLLGALTAQAAAAGAIVLSAVAARAERDLQLGVIQQLASSNALARCLAVLIEEGPAATLLRQPRPQTVSPVLARACDQVLKALAELSEGQPVVIAVDDLQFADIASIQCLSYLARRASAFRILIALTECSRLLPADRLLHAEILRQSNCTRIALAPFSATGLTVMLRQRFGSGSAQRLASACHTLTGGSPLLIKALAEDSSRPPGEPATLVPGNAFASAVVTCLHRYEPDTVEFAYALAVLGDDATCDLLGELLAISPESAAHRIKALTASGLLEAGQFRHPAVRQAVLDHMTAEERAALHGRAAQALYDGGAALAVLVSHLVDAQRIEARWVVPVLREAAEQALACGEVSRAISYLRRAEGDCADDQQRASIRLMLAAAEWRVNPEGAARRLAPLVTDAQHGRLDDDSLSELVYYLLWMGDTDNASQILASLGSEPGPPAGSPLGFLYPGLVRTSARPGGKEGGEAVVMAERVLQERTLNDPTLASTTTALMTLICDDMLDRAAFWCNLLLRECGGDQESPLWNAVLTGFLAMIETRRGNLAVAENQARTALALLSPKAWGVAIGGPLSSLLLTTTASRKHDDAAACLRVPFPEAMFGTPYGLLYLYGRGDYYLGTGRPHAALADFSECGCRMTAWGLDQPGLVPWRVKVAEAYLLMGETDKARMFAQEQLARVRDRSPRTRGMSLRVLALAGQPSKRTTLLRESAEILKESGARLELAYTFSELSNAHHELGEHSRAQWAARQARNLADRCGAQALRVRLSKSDMDLWEPGSAMDHGLLAHLSDAEQRVAELAAYGYTNTQIAGKLYVTVSTVEQHLTRVYRKLGVAGRAELPIGI